jgi:hypothetical protein
MKHSFFAILAIAIYGLSTCLEMVCGLNLVG